MFGWFMPRYPRHMYRHHRRYGLGRGLLWGLLIGPWLFRRALRWGMGPRRGWYGGYGGYGRPGGFGRPGGYGRYGGPDSNYF